MRFCLPTNFLYQTCPSPIIGRLSSNGLTKFQLPKGNIMPNNSFCSWTLLNLDDSQIQIKLRNFDSEKDRLVLLENNKPIYGNDSKNLFRGDTEYFLKLHTLTFTYLSNIPQNSIENKTNSNEDYIILEIRTKSEFQSKMALWKIFVIGISASCGLYIFLVILRCCIEKCIITISTSIQNHRLSVQQAKKLENILTNLTEHDFCKDIDKYNQKLCAICLNEYVEKVKIRKVPVCGHIFHSKCIEIWIHSKINSIVRCPICNYDLLMQDRNSNQNPNTNDSFVNVNINGNSETM